MKQTIYIACIAFALINAAFAFQENLLFQLLFAVSLLGLGVAGILSIVHLKRTWSQVRWRALLPGGFYLFVLISSGAAGLSARDAYFRSIIPELENQIQTYETDGEFPETDWKGYGISPDTLASGDIVVTFWWGGGFPVKHTALVYCATDEPLEYFRAGGWNKGYALEEDWYVVKD